MSASNNHKGAIQALAQVDATGPQGVQQDVRDDAREPGSVPPPQTGGGAPGTVEDDGLECRVDRRRRGCGRGARDGDVVSEIDRRERSCAS